MLGRESVDENDYHISTFSGGSNCVAVAKAADGAYLVKHSRDSTDRIVFNVDEWKAFIVGVKHGEFDF
jgi:hypothetical protein